jgi:hypothetical protein
MKTLISALIIFTAFVVNIYPQSNDIQNIIEYCRDLDSRIEFEGGYLVHSARLETNRRAIGIQYTNVKYYYSYPGDSVIETENEVKFLYIYKPPLKVTVEYNIAASQNIFIEYYFGTEGNLIFYYMLTKGVYTCGEEKYFFKNDELLKVTSEPIENCVDKDGTPLIDFTSGKYKSYEKDKDFTRHDLFLAGNILKKARKYLKMFDELVKLEEIDKE